MFFLFHFYIWAVAKLPIVCIVGRPNVGKSSLFNRILGRRAAVVSDRDGVHLSPPHRTTAFYEDRLLLIADRCEKVGDELLDGSRGTLSERTEPANLAAKFYEVAARCIGRAIDVASKRESREELDELKKTVREMRGAH